MHINYKHMWGLAVEMYQLRHFLAVQAHGSISKAAEAINVSQPAVTRSIKKLELDLGAKLLQRVGGGMQPTDIGELFATHARGILQQSRRVVEDVDAMKEGKDGRVVLGISSDNVQSYILPELLTRWVNHESSGRLLIDRVTPAELGQKITQADIDVSFCAIFGIDYGPDKNTEVLLQDKMCVWARKSHPILARNEITISDVSAQEWAFMGLGRNPEDFVQAHFEGKGLNPPRIAVQSSSIGVLRSAILNSNLIGMLPENYVRDQVAEGSLVKLNFPGLEVTERIGIVTSKLRPLTKAQERLCQMIRDICSESLAVTSHDTNLETSEI